MATVVVNFECDDKLKEDFEKTIKESGFQTVSEALRDFMRKVVNINKKSLIEDKK